MTLTPARQTRVALLSPLGLAGITTLQVAGQRTGDFVGGVFRDGKSRKIAPGFEQNKIYHGYIVDQDGGHIDRVLVCCSELRQAGSEVVDICCHGGFRPGQKVMETLVAAGACAVDASELPGAGLGEFVDLAGGSYEGVAGEALVELCRARTELAVEILSGQIQGGLVEKLRRLISEALSAEQLRCELDVLLDSWRWGRRLTELGKIAVVGAVNAGKSSLANCLSGQSGSIVTSEAGTTRDWVTHETSLGGVPVILIDTAGHRETTDPLELEAIRLAEQQASHADVQLMVIDGSRSRQSQPKLCEGIKTVIAVNKADVQGFSLDVVDADLAKWPCVGTSAVTGQGLGEVTLALFRALGCEGIGRAGAVVFTERQRDCLQEAVDVLSKGGAESLGAAKQALRKCLGG